MFHNLPHALAPVIGYTILITSAKGYDFYAGCNTSYGKSIIHFDKPVFFAMT